MAKTLNVVMDEVKAQLGIDKALLLGAAITEANEQLGYKAEGAIPAQVGRLASALGISMVALASTPANAAIPTAPVAAGTAAAAASPAATASSLNSGLQVPDDADRLNLPGLPKTLAPAAASAVGGGAADGGEGAGAAAEKAAPGTGVAAAAGGMPPRPVSQGAAKKANTAPKATAMRNKATAAGKAAVEAADKANQRPYQVVGAQAAAARARVPSAPRPAGPKPEP